MPTEPQVPKYVESVHTASILFFLSETVCFFCVAVSYHDCAVCGTFLGDGLQAGSLILNVFPFSSVQDGIGALGKAHMCSTHLSEVSPTMPLN